MNGSRENRDMNLFTTSKLEEFEWNVTRDGGVFKFWNKFTTKSKPCVTLHHFSCLYSPQNIPRKI